MTFTSNLRPMLNFYQRMTKERASIFPHLDSSISYIIYSGTVLCHLRTYDERWYWQFDFGSKLTIVTLLCITMTLCAI